MSPLTKNGCFSIPECTNGEHLSAKQAPRPAARIRAYDHISRKRRYKRIGEKEKTDEIISSVLYSVIYFFTVMDLIVTVLYGRTRKA